VPDSNYRKNAATLLLAVIGMLIFISLLGNFTTAIDAFQVELGLTVFDHGMTQLSMPPLGRVRARTHFPPLMFKVALANINLDQLQTTIGQVDDEQFLSGLRHDAWRTVHIFIGRLLLLAFLGGMAGPYFFGERERRRLLAAGLVGMLVLGTLLVVSYATFQPLAFMNPEFEGILKAAPWMFGLLEEALFKVRTLGEQLEVIAVNINLLFEQVERLEPVGTVDGLLKVAHISDLHNNPAGMDFVAQVVATFNVDIVIDTGDITDFGTPIEAELAVPIENFGIPYVFVPGNHDSPEVIARLSELENVIVLEEGIVEVSGLRIAGIADPSSRDTGMVVAADYILDEYAARLHSVLDGAEATPHVVAVHHPRIARAFLGRVNVILTGHIHQLSIDEKGSSVMINAGTTGAAGVRGLQARRETPFTLVLLHWDKRADGEFYLKAADVIRVFQLQSGFSLERRLFGSTAEDEGEEEEF
jgi:Icc-related predicted phosphoesterase